MPTMVTDDPLRVACVFSDGSRAEFELAGLPNPRLARDLAAGLVDLIHPHGNADSVGTVVGWLGLRQPGHSRLIRGIDRVVVQRWVLRHGLVGVDCAPLKIHRARIRTTHQAMRNKRTWTGNSRATIDPNHTPAVEGDHHLSVSTLGQRRVAETIIEDVGIWRYQNRPNNRPLGG